VNRRFALGAAAGSVAAFALFTFVLLGGHGSLTRDPGLLGGFLDAQGRAILDGGFAVDPAKAGFEGIVTDGKTYVYFGPVPSLLRLPVLAVTHSLDGRLTQLSMLLAMVVLLLAGAQLQWRVRELLRAGAPVTGADAVGAGLLQLALGAGAIPLYLASRIVAYHEVELWGAALALAAVGAVVGVLMRPTVGRVAWAGVLTTLAVNTRFSVGLAPLAALAVIAVVLLRERHRRRGRESKAASGGVSENVPHKDVFCHTPLSPALFVALVLSLAVPVLSYAAISEIKFRQPFGLPLDRQVASSFDPARRAALAANHNSLFGAKFIPTTALQAARPDALGTVRSFPWLGVPKDKPTIVGDVVLDTDEQSLSVPTSMLLLCVLTVIGIVFLVRGPPPRRTLLAVLLATLVGFLPSLTIAYVTTRYLADIVPFLFLGAAVGVLPLLTWRHRGWALAGVAVLALFGIAVNGATGLVNGRLISAETPIGDRAGFVLFQDGVDHTRKGVRSGPILPRLAPGAPGDLFVVGSCDGLYVTTLNEGWLPIERTAGDGYHSLDVRVPDRQAPFAIVGTGPDRVVAFARPGAGGTVFGLRQRGAVRSRTLRTGPTVRALLSIDSLGGGSFVSLRVDGHFVGLAKVPFGPRAPVRTTALARPVPTPAPICEKVTR
jgi:hypothetical protein